jgi:hypothetical protein
VVNCENCHALPLGANRLVNFEDVRVGRDMKTGHLHNVYQKVGRFNTAGPQVSGLEIDALLNRYRQSAEPITFTCVPPGDGVRSALDRDLDGYLDGDELLAGSDPASALSHPTAKRPTT